MSNISWGYWTRRVSSHIRFKPDRAAVEEELLAHLEDKRDMLLHSGMARYEAEKKALSEMGDADEIGEALSAAHRPWLGYLWLWSRRALILCVAVLLFSTLGAAGRLPLTSPEQDPGWAEWYEGDEHYTVTELTPLCRDESGGFTFTIPRAELVRNETYTASYESEGQTYTDTVEEGCTLYLTVEAEWLLPSATGFTAFRCFYAVDDLGNVYPDFFERRAAEYGKTLTGNYGQVSLRRSQYDAWIGVLDPEASWIELRYDRDGRDVRLRIDLTGGETP